MKTGIDFIGVGCGAMVFDNGLVFLAKRGPKARNEQGKWDFPGGSVEFGERCENAVKREIKEEYGMDIEVMELLDVVNHIIPEEKQHWVSPSFIAKRVSGKPEIKEPTKCTEIKWARLGEIDPSSLSSPSKLNFEKYVKKYGLNPPKLLPASKLL